MAYLSILSKIQEKKLAAKTSISYSEIGVNTDLRAEDIVDTHIKAQYEASIKETRDAYEREIAALKIQLRRSQVSLKFREL